MFFLSLHSPREREQRKKKFRRFYSKTVKTKAHLFSFLFRKRKKKTRSLDCLGVAPRPIYTIVPSALTHTSKELECRRYKTNDTQHFGDAPLEWGFGMSYVCRLCRTRQKTTSSTPMSSHNLGSTLHWCTACIGTMTLQRVCVCAIVSMAVQPRLVLRVRHSSGGVSVTMIRQRLCCRTFVSAVFPGDC